MWVEDFIEIVTVRRAVECSEVHFYTEMARENGKKMLLTFMFAIRDYPKAM